MDLDSRYKRIAIFRKEDLNYNMRKLEMADFALNEIDNNEFRVTKDRYGWLMGVTYHLSDTEVAKLLLNSNMV